MAWRTTLTSWWADAVRTARDLGLPVTITGAVEVGSAPGSFWPKATAPASLVVGDRGLGGFTSLLLGSVAVAVAAHATCPVVVARGTQIAGDVLVGVDGSASADRALDSAVREAELRGVGITIVHAYTCPTSPGPGDMLPLVYDRTVFVDVQRVLLDQAVASATARYPEITVSGRLIADDPRHALLECAATASLVVVGSRGWGGLAGLLLGSVSHALLHQAPCPVAIVR